MTNRRTIDGKFHVEGSWIIKTTNGDVVPEEEPLFLIRARDYLALPLLRHYLELARQDGCTDYHLEGLLLAIQRFETFSVEHQKRMKQPGITRGL